MSSPVYPLSLGGGTSSFILIVLVDYMLRETFGRPYDLISFVGIYLLAAAARIGTFDVLTATKMMSQALQGKISEEIKTTLFYLFVTNALMSLKSLNIVREVSEMGPTEAFVAGIVVTIGLLTNYNFLTYVFEKGQTLISIGATAEKLTQEAPRESSQNLGLDFSSFGEFLGNFSKSMVAPPPTIKTTHITGESTRPRARRIRVHKEVEELPEPSDQELEDLLNTD